MEKTRDYFDKNVESFSESRNQIWPELNELKKYIKDGERILDLGCGNGRLFPALGGSAAGGEIKYIGIDASRKLIEKAREKYGDHFKVADILSLPCTQETNKTAKSSKEEFGWQGLPFSDNYFDSIWAIAVFHHIPSKALRAQMLEGVKRILKPGGKVIITCWNLYQSQYFKLLLKFTFRKFFGLSKLDFKDVLLSPKKIKIQRYYHAFTKRELKKLFQKTGFRVEGLKYLKRNNKKTNILVVAVKQ